MPEKHCVNGGPHATHGEGGGFNAACGKVHSPLASVLMAIHGCVLYGGTAARR